MDPSASASAPPTPLGYRRPILKHHRPRSASVTFAGLQGEETDEEEENFEMNDIRISHAAKQASKRAAQLQSSRRPTRREVQDPPLDSGQAQIEVYNPPVIPPLAAPTTTAPIYPTLATAASAAATVTTVSTIPPSPHPSETSFQSTFSLPFQPPSSS